MSTSKSRATRSSRSITRRHSIILTVAFICFWVPIILFARLAGEVLEHQPIGFDTSILYWLHAHASGFGDNFFLFFTSIGNPLSMMAVGLVLLLYFVLRRHYRKALALLLGVGGAGLANIILKGLFARNRPSFWPSLVHESSYSFPSGHAMASSALVLTLIILGWHTRWRWPLVVVGGVIGLLVGVSRLYLGVHYPTDVLAGWCVSLIWVLLVSSLLYDFPFALGARLGIVHRSP